MEFLLCFPIYLLFQILHVFSFFLDHPVKNRPKQGYLHYLNTGELGYGGLNGTRKIGPSYAKSVVYI